MYSFIRNQKICLKEFVNEKYSDIRIILSKDFQNRIFSELIDKYSSKKLVSILNISRGMIYHYKNYRVNNISLEIFKRITTLLNLNEEEVKRNIIGVLTIEEIKNKGLILGRNLRIKKAKEKFKINLSLSEYLIKKNGILILDLFLWLEKTNWINRIKSQTGIIKNVKDVKILHNYIEIEYEAYKNGKGFEYCKSYLPKQIILNNDFFYFLGLKFGDGTSGARVGIVNKDYDIIKNAYYFLKKLFPDSKIYLDLNCYDKSDKILVQNVLNKFRTISFDIDVYQIPTLLGNYCFSVYVTNRIFSRVLYHLIENLDELLKIMNFEQKGAFLAGFFDAEGNVNKIDGNLRFSQKIKRNVEIISNLLLKEGYHIRYDGSNIVIAYKKEYHEDDLKLFERQILPFMISSIKRKETKDVIKGYLVKEDYKEIVKIISKNPDITHKVISTKINRRKCSAKLRALLNAGYISKKGKMGETFKYRVTPLGTQWIGWVGGD